MNIAEEMKAIMIEHSAGYSTPYWKFSDEDLEEIGKEIEKYIEDFCEH